MFALKKKRKRKKEDRTDLIEDLDFKERIQAVIVFKTFLSIFFHLLAMKENGILKADMDLVISLGRDVNRWKIQITWKPTGPTSFNQKSLLITSTVRSSAFDQMLPIPSWAMVFKNEPYYITINMTFWIWDIMSVWNSVIVCELFKLWSKTMHSCLFIFI